ncbi:hypothetical protein CTA1_12764 [Colletotrichum tanaceti]|uniref:Uncharacterized protein n=1 Tax=Colletotrichum tanaceti TaxID=1306861 RepID=A0A4U6XIX4_9PEZI|nr:hypothetical protein CTA1_12764 [Colletotrichum tanaceti]
MEHVKKPKPQFLSRMTLRPSDPQTPSDTRVILLDGELFLKGPPRVARVGEGGLVGDGGDLAVPLDELHREALGGVPADVAVHQPGARVVRVPGHDEVAGGRQHGGVAAGRVVRLERHVARVGPLALGEDPEVVAVQVDGVRDGEGGLDDEVDPLVGLVELDDGLLLLPGLVAVDDGLEGRVAPVDEHAGAVEVPLEEAGLVLADGAGLELVPVGGRDGLGHVGDEVVRLVVAAVLVEVAGGGRDVDGAGVGDDAPDVVDSGVVGAGRLGDGADPEGVGGGGLVGVDDDVVALAHGDVEHGGLVGDDGDEVGGDDLHGVVVDGELPVGVDGGVDEPQAVGGAGGPGDVVAPARLGRRVVVDGVDVGAVDEAVVEGRGPFRLGGVVELVDGLVVPVVEEEHAEVLVVVGGGGAVDDDAAEDALPGLQGEVGVVPGRAVLQGPPGVGDGAAGGGGALGDGADAVVLVGVVLADAVEVDAGAVVGLGQGVDDVDLDGVAPVGEEGRAGDGPVDGHGGAGDAVGGHGDVRQLEPVLARDAGVGGLGPVVGVDGVVTPLAPRGGRVAAAGVGTREQPGLGEGAGSRRGKGYGRSEGAGHE